MYSYTDGRSPNILVNCAHKIDSLIMIKKKRSCRRRYLPKFILHRGIGQSKADKNKQAASGMKHAPQTKTKKKLKKNCTRSR